MSDAATTTVPMLVERSGPGQGRTHEIPLGEHIVGRGSDAGVRVEHRDVSRRHARLEVGAESILLEDLGSKNGVFIGDQRVHGTARLGHGDRFSIGDLVLEVIHPGSRLERLLARAGETTVTRPRAQPASHERKSGSLILPLIGVVVFGALVLSMLFL